MASRDQLNMLSGMILDACVAVHREMGPGLLESIYESCLITELSLRGIQVKNQVMIPLRYKGLTLSKDFRVDLLVENEVIVEVKAVDALLPVHEAQLISYLKLADKRLGLLVNFNVRLMKDGFRRFVNGF